MTVASGRALPIVALLAVTAAWGSMFFLIKDLLTQISVLDFLSIRFLIAAAVLFAVVPRSVMRLSRREMPEGLVLGLVYGVPAETDPTPTRTLPSSMYDAAG